MGTYEVEQDLAASTATLGGQSLVFHCHFYNCALQSAVESARKEGARTVVDAAQTAGVIPLDLAEPSAIAFSAQGPGGAAQLRCARPSRQSGTPVV